MFFILLFIATITEMGEIETEDSIPGAHGAGAPPPQPTNTTTSGSKIMRQVRVLKKNHEMKRILKIDETLSKYSFQIGL